MALAGNVLGSVQVSLRLEATYEPPCLTALVRHGTAGCPACALRPISPQLLTAPHAALVLHVMWTVVALTGVTLSLSASIAWSCWGLTRTACGVWLQYLLIFTLAMCSPPFYQREAVQYCASATVGGVDPGLIGSVQPALCT